MKKFTFGGVVALTATLVTTLLALSMPVNAATAHSHYFKKVGTVSSTCTVQGYTQYKCSCGATKRNYKAALGHNYRAESGVSMYNSSYHRRTKSCTRCSSKMYEYMSHSFTSSITKSATCTANGVKTYKCKCGYTKTESIAKKEHSLVDKGYLAYNDSQHKKIYQCSKCGMQTYSYAQHAYRQFVITTSHTEYRCALCKHILKISNSAKV